MARPKRVAIIGPYLPRALPSSLKNPGAGPSGLVTAKTLLRHFPAGTFHPVIFEKKRRIGGIWAVDHPSEEIDPVSVPTESTQKRAFVSPSMRTNLSRFSVAFSDLSWETALGKEDVPVFPRAWEVRRYLEKYAQVFVPDEYIRLGARVLRTTRWRDGDESDARWVVEWVDESHIDKPDSRIQRKEFDFLVVASGHFGTPSIPHIQGLSSFPNTIHSSELQSAEDIRHLLEKSPKGGKLVVVGGSMSGVEAATSLALHLSSLNFTPGSQDQAGRGFEVWHVGPGPFWVLPTNLPHRSGDDVSKSDTMPFVPLDLFLYDLDRRPPGAKEMAFGPVSPDQIPKRHQFFQDILGEDYGKVGGIGHSNSDGADSKRPPWVGIADYYAEFIRSGTIKPLAGKVSSVASSSSGHGTIEVQTPTSQIGPLTDVAAIVVATGFSPSDSLSILPEEVLSTLEYSKEDLFLPLILDKWSSSHGDIPDIGFVGFYRGAFWGPAEMQAQSVANTWAKLESGVETPTSLSAEELDARMIERHKVREYRDFRPTTLRGQFPLGDYVGLMESCASQLDRGRISLDRGIDENAQSLGPVVPARYPPTLSKQESGEIEATLDALNKTLLAESNHGSVGATAAIFRALHGQWKHERVVTTPSDNGDREDKSSGQTIFHPRYPSIRDYEAEYLSAELDDSDSNTVRRLVYRHRDVARFPREAGIQIWSVNQEISPNSAFELVSALQVEPVATVTDSRKLLIKADDPSEPGPIQHRYDFYLDRVAITTWCHIVERCSGGKLASRQTTWYRR